MEAVDPEYYKNLCSILEHPLEMLGLDLTFSADTSVFGRMEIVDLIEDGRNIPVTDDNKMEYVRRVTEEKMSRAIKAQIDAYCKGFYELVSQEHVRIFTPVELELLISGMPTIDLDDLRAHTELVNYRPADATIRHFWSVLEEFSPEERASFLQFVTGSASVPLGGFANLQGMRGLQKFSIHRGFSPTGSLPSTHTCFNQLDLPPNEDRAVLKEKLITAVESGQGVFGLA